MRLINEDDVLNRITNPYERAHVLRWTREAPTIEAVPERKKGWWCFTPDGMMVCSNCHDNPTNRIIVNGSLIYDMTPIKKRMKFCPNCGANMRGEQDDND